MKMTLPIGFWNQREWSKCDSGNYYTYVQVAKMLSKKLKVDISRDKVKGWVRKGCVPFRYLTKSEGGEPRKYVDSFNVKLMEQYIREWLQNCKEPNDILLGCRPRKNSKGFAKVLKAASYSNLEPIQILRDGIQLSTAVKYLHDKYNITASTTTLRLACVENKIPYETRSSGGEKGMCYIIHPTTLDEIAEADKKIKEETLSAINCSSLEQRRFDEVQNDKITDVVQKIQEQVTANNVRINDLTERISEITKWIRDNFETDFSQHKAQQQTERTLQCNEQ